MAVEAVGPDVSEQSRFLVQSREGNGASAVVFSHHGHHHLRLPGVEILLQLPENHAGVSSGNAAVRHRDLLPRKSLLQDILQLARVGVGSPHARGRLSDAHHAIVVAASHGCSVSPALEPQVRDSARTQADLEQDDCAEAPCRKCKGVTQEQSLRAVPLCRCCINHGLSSSSGRRCLDASSQRRCHPFQ